MRWILFLFCFFLSGCQNFDWATDGAKVLLPVNMVAGYFGTVAIHEVGHAATANSLGADHIQIDWLPAKDEGGDFHFALTTVRTPSDWSDTDESLFLTMGPTATFAAHVSLRELLKTGVVPRELQPSLAWLALCNGISYYFHVGAGLLRIDSSDLGKEDAWVSGVMLVGALTYDLYDLFSDNGNYLNVLLGEGFYEESQDRRYSLVSRPEPGGGFLGLRVRF